MGTSAKQKASKQDFARKLADQRSLQISDAMMQSLGKDELDLDLGCASNSDIAAGIRALNACPSFIKVRIVNTAKRSGTYDYVSSSLTKSNINQIALLY